ncbi:MAG TPA: methylenetetrahydrofolate reductase [Solirubrobacteraceae bacterium]
MAADQLRAGPPQFEVLPLPQAGREAAQLPESARLTVTSSPRQGPEQTIELAVALKALGHSVTPHLAARLVRDGDHLDALLRQLETAKIDELFVIGGDIHAPVGKFSSADELLPLIRERPHGVRRIGIAAYPEGHPLIDRAVLDAALQRKARIADYVTTQMCFDGDALIRWIHDLRGGGIELPVLIGMPGVVHRRHLLEVSVRIGVGPSLAFFREQRGFRNLVWRPSHALEELFDAIVPHIYDPRLRFGGFHYFTFNQLLDTWRWDRDKRESCVRLVG